jgi:hypothetical protein
MALTPIGDEAITVSSSSVGLSSAEIPPTKTKVLLASVYNLSGGSAYYRNTGTASATAANGEHEIEVGDTLKLWGDKAITAARFIVKSGDSDAEIRVQYWGEG